MVMLIVPTVIGVGDTAVITGAAALLLELLLLELLLLELLLEPAAPTATVRALLKRLEEGPTWKVAVEAEP
jgi:hypothetical protein